VSLLGDETMNLLKAKFLMDDKVKDLSDYFDNKKALHEGFKGRYLEDEAKAGAILFLQPGLPVSTRFGYGVICTYRLEDNMIMAVLTFCDPPAKIWVTAKEIIDAERYVYGWI
jgi:hypothetical protein